MAMIEGRDYVTITHWECPSCHKYHGNLKTRIGRYPCGSTLLCQGCAREWYPSEARDVGYDPSVAPNTK